MSFPGWCCFPGKSAIQQEASHCSQLVTFQGIQVLVDALEAATHANPSHEMLGEYTTAVLNALWDCVVTNRRNLAHLLADDGLGDLLDVIEACHAAVQPLALAILAGEILT